jgi:hypothetical protein
VDELTTENSTLRNELKRLQDSCKALNADNSMLADTLGDLKAGRHLRTCTRPSLNLLPPPPHFFMRGLLRKALDRR